MGREITIEQDATARERSYFSAEHQASGPTMVVSSVWFKRRGLKKQVSVSYKLLYDRIYRAPRRLTAWLDDKDDAYVSKELDGWKDRINLVADFSSIHFPDFFVRQRSDFLRWCAKSAKASSIETYLFYLGRFVFPYFVQKLREESPEKWHPLYPDWEQYLAGRLATANSRNRCRTALRRYLKFLKANGLCQSAIMPSNENYRSGRREGEVLPGELPEWANVKAWLETLPPGRCRWVITMCAAFGVRVSEALASQPENLIGEQHLTEIQNINDIVRRTVQTGHASAFFNVREANKRATRNPQGVFSSSQNCTFIACSNDPVSERINDPTSARRFWQLNCADRLDWPAINAIDYDALWRSVDESAACPLLPYLAEIQTIQHRDIRAKDLIERWLELACAPAPFTADSPTTNELFEGFMGWCQWQGSTSHPGLQKFSRNLEGKIKAVGWDAESKRSNRGTTWPLRLLWSVGT